MPHPLQALHAEHASMAAVLHALQHLSTDAEAGRPVALEVFKAILYYLDVFPERHHHPKEDELLFAAVRRRSELAEAVLERLEQQHASGADAIRRLEQALLRWEAGGDAERQAFCHAAHAYVARYREHMRLEELELMPLARQVLRPGDWEAIEAGFAAHDDPLRGAQAADDPVTLYQRILDLAPEPLGFAKGD